jgi:hypothetical protein
MTAPLYLEWACDPRHNLAANILTAADRLHAREHVIATVALVNPATLAAAGDIAIDGIAIKAVGYVMEKHVMVGVEDMHKLITLAHVASVEAEQGRSL